MLVQLNNNAPVIYRIYKLWVIVYESFIDQL